MKKVSLKMGEREKRNKEIIFHMNLCKLRNFAGNFLFLFFLLKRNFFISRISSFRKIRMDGKCHAHRSARPSNNSLFEGLADLWAISRAKRSRNGRFCWFYIIKCRTIRDERKASQKKILTDFDWPSYNFTSKSHDFNATSSKGY